MNSNNFDDWVDDKIKDCITNKKHFFMFAGAGSGKTRSLVNALTFIANEQGASLLAQSKRVAVITYTNAACDEIMRRIGYNPLFTVSTIHSFLWELIKPFQRDIKKWVGVKLQGDLLELDVKKAKARSKDYSGEVTKKKEQLDNLNKFSRFIYNPNGMNLERNSLNHAQVISKGAEFIGISETVQYVLTSKFPILLIDESQDTKKELVDALLEIEEKYKGCFVIGMFGDVMQRIYTDGKENMEAFIPDSWEKPNKTMNHRSNKRIIQLANAVRQPLDGIEQQPRTDKTEGYVRLFVMPDVINKERAESYVFTKMAEITSDNNWLIADERKTLVLEHSMAASRLGFTSIDSALRKQFGQSYLDGSIEEIRFLMTIVYPIVCARLNKDEFALMKVLRKYAAPLRNERLSTSANQNEVLKSINENIHALVSLWDEEKAPNCIDVFKKLSKMDLFALPKRIEQVLDAKAVENVYLVF